MRRLSIARSIRLALIGLSAALAGLAGFGIASLYSSRQQYENRINAAFAAQTDAANLLAASVVEEATIRNARGPHRAVFLGRAQDAFDRAIAQAERDTAGDTASLRDVEATAAAERQVRLRLNASTVRGVRAGVVTLATRQLRRRADARATARSDSRGALIAILVGGVLALLSVFGLVSALLARVRDPLDDLVATARRLADGDLRARVTTSGPDELRSLGSAFNSMADDLSRALARLEDERSRLDLTIRSLGDALLVVDSHGVVAAANPRAAELLPELSQGARVADTRPGLPALADALIGEVAVERDGRTLAATASTLPSDGDDPRPGVVWTVRDVTERARLERLKTEFVATASHELRSPLTSIKGFVELLSQTKRLTVKQREFVDIILTSTNRLVDLVDELLEVASVEAGQIELRTRPIDLGEIVGEVATLMAPRFAEQRQTLTVAVSAEAPLANADPDRIRQILINLVTNAHLYTPAGGHVGVEVMRAGSQVSLVVTDDGRGMTTEQLDRAFDRFYRATDQDGGTGLGLSIVRSLVDLHGGAVDVASQPGAGTTVRVLLPHALPG